MIDPTRWAGLSVQAFFADYNWSGTAPRLEESARGDLSETSGTVPSLLCLTVQDFLAQGNWRGLAPTPLTETVSANFELPETIPALQLTLQAFWAKSNWSGRGLAKGVSKGVSKVTAPPAPTTSPLPSANADDLGLNDLSALF